MKKNNPHLRKCISCQQQKEKSTLIRVVRNPDGTVAIDENGKSNGRGAYICKSPECLNSAKKKKRFETALKIEIPAELFSVLERIISD